MRGHALLIATSHYSDPKLSALQSTQIDADGLRQVISDRRIGDFRVTDCLNASCQSWREHIEEFFVEASHEESLLLYISGHAIKDRDGKLYFAASDTRVNRLIATGIPSALIQEASNSSRSQRITMIFDTCFSGAFAKGIAIKSDWRSLNAGEYFHEGTGKVIITASDALQYALSGDSVNKGVIPSPSIFSKHLIEGLRTGQADTDNDGQITTEDLFLYVSSALRRDGAQQQPQRWSFGVTNDFIIARNPAPKPGQLPGDVAELLSDTRPMVRALAIGRLEALLSSPDARLAMAAVQALERLQVDDSRSVQNDAHRALQLYLTTRIADRAPESAAKSTEEQISQLRPEKDADTVSVASKPKNQARAVRFWERRRAAILTVLGILAASVVGLVVMSSRRQLGPPPREAATETAANNRVPTTTPETIQTPSHYGTSAPPSGHATGPPSDSSQQIGRPRVSVAPTRSASDRLFEGVDTVEQAEQKGDGVAVEALYIQMLLKGDELWKKADVNRITRSSPEYSLSGFHLNCKWATALWRRALQMGPAPAVANRLKAKLRGRGLICDFKWNSCQTADGVDNTLIFYSDDLSGVWNSRTQTTEGSTEVAAFNSLFKDVYVNGHFLGLPPWSADACKYP